MQLLRAPLAVLSLAAGALAQTFIVDAANGPGTNFTEIAAAVAAVPDGSKLEVRAGAYQTFSISGKGLSVFCIGAVTLTGPQGIQVSGTSAAQTVVIRGVQLFGTIQLVQCQGAVVLEHLSVLPLFLPPMLMLRVYDCAQVHVADCMFTGGSPAVEATNSTVMLRGTTLRGGNTLHAYSSAVDFVDCVQQGGTGILGTPAMFLQGGSARLVGGSVSANHGPCISGVGTVRVDPTTILTPGISFPVSNVPLAVASMPSVVASDGPLGGVVTTAMRVPVGEFGGLLVGLPGTPWSYPGIADPIWLLPGSEAVCALTVVGAPLLVTFAIPNVPAMRGMRFGWQGISHGAASGFQASNPAITTHW
jgi:hypothetical protein